MDNWKVIKYIAGVLLFVLIWVMAGELVVKHFEIESLKHEISVREIEKNTPKYLTPKEKLPWWKVVLH